MPDHISSSGQSSSSSRYSRQVVSHTQSQRLFGVLYALLVALRFIVAVHGAAYVHPDEFFQSTEIVVSDFLFHSAGDAASRPLRTWEFDPAYPARSMASVRFFNAPAIAAIEYFKRAQGGVTVSPDAMWTIQRISYVIYSLLLDYCIFRLASSTRNARAAVLLLASNGAVLTLCTRSFSNGLEASLLALSWTISQRVLSQHTIAPWSNPLLGVLLALGFFTRFTFAIFALPLGIQYLHQLLKRWRQTGVCPLTDPLALVSGFLSCSACHIMYDTYYYGAQAEGSHGWVVAPLNALKYNLKSDNLADHGIHSRYLNFLVNAAMILGAATWLYCLCMLNPSGQAAFDGSDFSLLLGLFLPLCILSLSPHQEPRFLLPLVLVSTLLVSSHWSRLPRRLRRLFLLLHALQSVLMTIFFGFAHQGGVISSLLWINQHATSETTTTAAVKEIHVHSWRLFMPPRHLVLDPAKAEKGEMKLWDHGSIPLDDLWHDITSLSLDWHDSVDAYKHREILLLAPNWALCSSSSSLPSAALAGLHLEPMKQTTWHLDTDHLPESIQLFHTLRSPPRHQALHHHRHHHHQDEDDDDTESSALDAVDADVDVGLGEAIAKTFGVTVWSITSRPPLSR